MKGKIEIVVEEPAQASDPTLEHSPVMTDADLARMGIEWSRCYREMEQQLAAARAEAECLKSDLVNTQWEAQDMARQRDAARAEATEQRALVGDLTREVEGLKGLLRECRGRLVFPVDEDLIQRIEAARGQK